MPYVIFYYRPNINNELYVILHYYIDIFAFMGQLSFMANLFLDNSHKLYELHQTKINLVQLSKRGLQAPALFGWDTCPALLALLAALALMFLLDLTW